MGRVGIRELKDKLSAYLDRVRAGEIIEITDRGRPVARIFPAGLDEGLARLIGEGKVSWSGRRFTRPKRLVRQRPGAPSMSDAVSEDRR